MKDLITVIINVYNGEKFINKCLDCIINQTYKNLEILIINDGSTDNTLNIMKKYKDKRIRVISTENKGLSLSRNVGIDNALGEYLYFIDVDDFIELDTIEYLYNMCKRTNTLISTCRSLQVKDFNNNKNVKNENIKVISKEDMLKKVLLYDDVAIWNKLIHKNLFNDIRFKNRIANDILVTYKLVLKTDKISYSNKVKYYYLKHDNSITYKNNEDRSIDLYNAALERYYYIKKIYPNLIENEISAIYRIMYTYFNKSEKVQHFLKEVKAIKLSKKLFSINILTSKIKFKEKIKITLFYITPSLYRTIRKIRYK